jgi:ATPase subunit of ABC transporter with duplicated ATPase domains
VLDPDLTLIENLKCLAPSRPAHELRTLLGRFLFAQETALKKARVLSGGERIRAGLACILGAEQAPELLILDEPTNNLDLTSLEELTSVLQDYRGALLVVSHDLMFVEEIELTKRYDLSAESISLA